MEDKQIGAMSTSNSFKSFVTEGSRETWSQESLPTPRITLRHFVC